VYHIVSSIELFYFTENLAYSMNGLATAHTLDTHTYTHTHIHTYTLDDCNSRSFHRNDLLKTDAVEVDRSRSILVCNERWRRKTCFFGAVS
jgi:hypothetical protein